MKMWKLAPAVIALSLSTSAFAAKLNVPDDFPNSFHMDLLAGNVFVNAGGSFDMFPNKVGSQVNFDATVFDGIGAGEGTSSLTLTSTDDWKISDFFFFGNTGSIFIDGNGTGSLVDNGNGTGEWTLDIPLYILWNNIHIDLDSFSLSTNATYQLTDANGNPPIDPETGLPISQISGSSMSYETGDAFLVGQGTVIDNEFFNGIQITMGVYGNDPVLLATPIPSAVWLFGSGLIGLFGLARRKADA